MLQEHPFFSPHLSTASAVPRLLGSHMPGSGGGRVSARLKGSVCCHLRLSGVLAGPEGSFPFQPELAPLTGIIRHGKEQELWLITQSVYTALPPGISQALKQRVTTRRKGKSGHPEFLFLQLFLTPQ